MERCNDCRKVGMYHCSDPVNCGGMKSMIDYHEAIIQMHKGNVVQYEGTTNGNVWNIGNKFCMQRGIIFIYHHAKNIDYQTCGHMVYDPDFRYSLTGETVDPRGWPERESIRPSMGYSRIGLNNV